MLRALAAFTTCAALVACGELFSSDADEAVLPAPDPTEAGTATEPVALIASSFDRAPGPGCGAPWRGSESALDTVAGGRDGGGGACRSCGGTTQVALGMQSSPILIAQNDGSRLVFEVWVRDPSPNDGGLPTDVTALFLATRLDGQEIRKGVSVLAVGGGDWSPLTVELPLDGYSSVSVATSAKTHPPESDCILFDDARVVRR